MNKSLVSLLGNILFFVLTLSAAFCANITYTYDQLNRLTGVVYEDGTIIEYMYDDAGNRTIRNVITSPGQDASFTATPMNGTAPLTVAFTDQSTGSIISWLWDFGDGASSTSQNPGHTYTDPGTYNVVLTVSNGTVTSSDYVCITVRYPVPVADFNASVISSQAPFLAQFTDTSTGTITNWSWDFGDGGASTSQNPTHTYISAGIYTVTLIVNGPGGTSGPKSTTITVSPPVADFTASATLGTAPFTMQFTDLSTGTIASRLWDFGDGQTGTILNPAHTYSTPGTFTVSLTAYGPAGSSTNTKNTYITVRDAPAGGIDQYTKLMLHFNGPNGSKIFTDSEDTPKTVTGYGNAQISTAYSKFGGACLKLDGKQLIPLSACKP